MLSVSGKPERLAGLLVDVRAAEADIAQHAVVELVEAVALPGAVLPEQERVEAARERPENGRRRMVATSVRKG
jgi:hypothetical protein